MPLLPPRLACKHVTAGGERVSSAVQHLEHYGVQHHPSDERDITCPF